MQVCSQFSERRKGLTSNHFDEDDENQKDLSDGELTALSSLHYYIATLFR